MPPRPKRLFSEASRAKKQTAWYKQANVPISVKEYVAAVERSSLSNTARASAILAHARQNGFQDAALRHPWTPKAARAPMQKRQRVAAAAAAPAEAPAPAPPLARAAAAAAPAAAPAAAAVAIPRPTAGASAALAQEEYDGPLIFGRHVRALSCRHTPHKMWEAVQIDEKLHLTSRQLSCHWCPGPFPTLALIEAHYLRKHYRHTQLCPYCEEPAVLQTFDQWSEHVRTCQASSDNFINDGTTPHDRWHGGLLAALEGGYYDPGAPAVAAGPMQEQDPGLYMDSQLGVNDAIYMEHKDRPSPPPSPPAPATPTR